MPTLRDFGRDVWGTGGTEAFTGFLQSSAGLSDNDYQAKLLEEYDKYKGTPVGALFEQEISSGGARRKASQLGDPNSQIYKTFQSQLRKNLLAGSSTDKFISANRARGLSTTGSGIIAEEQQQARESRINDIASNATQQFYLQSSGQQNSLLSQIMQNKLGRANLAEQKSQFDQSQPDWLDYGLGAVGVGVDAYSAGIFGK